MARAREGACYDNVEVLAVGGDFLFYASVKKARWYLGKGLATLVRGDFSSAPETTIQLNFETQGSGRQGDDFYANKLENVCVCCGLSLQETSKDLDAWPDLDDPQEFYAHDVPQPRVQCGLVKMHIVPHMYRQHFPEVFKSHSSHDVVACCLHCQQQYNSACDQYKKRIAKQYSVPIEPPPLPLLDVLQRLARKISACKRKDIPLEARTAVQAAALQLHAEAQALAGHLPPLELEAGALEELGHEIGARMKELHLARAEQHNHAQEVVQKVLALEHLQSFVEGWRQLFVKSMKPQALSGSWSIDRRIEDK